MLRAIDLYDRTLTRTSCGASCDETQKRNGWLIFTTHDVAETPSWIGCSPRLLEEVIAAVQAESMQVPADPRRAHGDRLRSRDLDFRTIQILQSAAAQRAFRP